ncbi:MAG: type VI secretion system baseplate subunit TssF, partial [Planctomycetia bacterium]
RAGRHRRTTARVPPRRPGDRGGVARGLEIAVDFDEQSYIGVGVFLFASVLERFFGLYASANSFTQFVARTSRGEIKRWPARAGERVLL